MSHSHSHDHGHDHSHVPTVTSANQRKILISFVLIFTFMIVEAVGGVPTLGAVGLPASGETYSSLSPPPLPAPAPGRTLLIAPRAVGKASEFGFCVWVHCRRGSRLYPSV